MGEVEVEVAYRWRGLSDRQQSSPLAVSAGVSSQLHRKTNESRDTAQLRELYRLPPILHLRLTRITGRSKTTIRHSPSLNRFKHTPGLFLVIATPRTYVLYGPSCALGNPTGLPAPFCLPSRRSRIRERYIRSPPLPTIYPLSAF